MFEDILQKVFLGNRVGDYFLFIFLFLAGISFIKVFQHFVLKGLNKWAKSTKTSLDDFLIELVQRIVLPLAYFGAFYLSVNTLILNLLLKRIIDIIGIALLTLFTARMATALITYGFDVYQKTRGKDVNLKRSMDGILRVVKLIVWAVAIIFFLDNMGFKISAVIAGLGIGGVAVALAAQAVLKDLFSYFSILFDRPFEIGDFIIIGEYLGCVEHIGIKTTRIRSLGGEQLVFSNSDLTDSRVRNYKRMQKRRVVFKLGVTYQTPLNKLKEIPAIIQKVIEEVENTTFDRAHFSSYADFSLVFEVVYYVLSSDYNKYMDIQQEINFGINKEFATRKIEFAYPTQTVYVNK